MDVLNGASLLIMGGIPDPLSVNRIQAKSGPLKVGSAASGHSLTAANDLLIAGKLEVDGLAYFDSAPTIGNYTLPTADGVADQVLRSNGAGTVSWATVSGVAAAQKIEDTDQDTWVHTESIADEDIIRFKTAGTERAVILANGKVGIGVSSPGFQLEILGASAVGEDAVIKGSSTDIGLGLYNTGTGGRNWRIVSSSGASGSGQGALLTYDGSGFGWAIDSNHNVGIGTTTPGSKLEIALATANLEIADAGSAGATEQAWVEVQVGGIAGYLRVYASK